MDIRALQYFISVVETGSISGAAKKLHISQPPLSQQIKLLESELDVILMERGARNIVLTDAGRTLYNHAISVIDIVNMATMEIQNFNKGVEGSLRIGIVSSCSTKILSIIENTFHTSFPNVTYQVFEKNTIELVGLLEKNVIELAFVRTPFSAEFPMNSMGLMQDAIVAVGNPSFFNTASEIVTPDEFKEKPLIVYRRWEAIITAYLKQNGIIPNYFCVNDDARTSLAWAQAGMGIAFVPSSILYNFNKGNLVCKQIDEKLLSTEICLLWKELGYLSPVAKNFIELIKSLAQDQFS